MEFAGERASLMLRGLMLSCASQVGFICASGKQKQGIFTV
jgi:hypothetical protein